MHPPVPTRALRQVRAQELWFAVLEAQTETGTPYLMFKVRNQTHARTLARSLVCTHTRAHTHRHVLRHFLGARAHTHTMPPADAPGGVVCHRAGGGIGF